MAHPALSNELPDRSGTRYQPLVHVAMAMATGVAMDRLLAPPIWIWIIALFTAMCVWTPGFKRRKSMVSLIAMMLAVVSLGAFWHNVHWNRMPVDDIYRFADDVGQPVYLQGEIVTNPIWAIPDDSTVATPQPTETRTRFTLTARSIRSKGKLVPVSGRLEVFVDGEIHGFVAGDDVAIAGSFSRIDSPGNPGQFDFARHFRGQGINCWLNITDSESIVLLTDSRSSFKSFGGRVKAGLNGLIWKYVSPEQAALASAMLLGNRDQLDYEQREHFMVTGTVHLLAISGLHVGILAGLFLAFVRTGLVPRSVGLLFTVAFVVSYAWLVEFRPPVVRAGILICLYCYCKWIGRESFSFNSLALAALIVMARNPSDLFSSGAQLSFLAVGSLIFGRRWIEMPASTDPIDTLIARSRPWHVKFARSLWRSVVATLMVSTVIWLFAFPLVAARFHVVSPIALIVNPVVLLPVTTALVSGFLVLIFGGWLPPVAMLAGSICELSLSALKSCIELGRSVPVGHWWTCGPTDVALLVFYSVVIALFVMKPDGIRFRSTTLLLIVWLISAWWVPSFISEYQARHRTTLVCTMVDVGHGNCVLLELAGGKNLLYDCGSIGSIRNAARNASGVLWDRRITHLDAVIISHADSDHFNGLPEISRQFAIDRIVVSSKMLAKRDRHDVAWLLNFFEQQGIPLQSVSAGDELDSGSDASIRVISPADDVETKSDNAESIVLEIQYAGRRILLTADVDGKPLDILFDSENLSAIDLAMVPHHGSANSRPDEFLQWARPGVAVVSSRRSTNESVGKGLLSQVPDQTSVFHTGRDGGVRFTIDSSGTTSVQSFRQDPW